MPILHRQFPALRVLVASALLVVLASCKDDGPGTAPPEPPPPQQLTVVVDSTVRLTPALTTNSFRQDTVLSYRVDPAPGFTDPLVIVDSLQVPISGTIRMDRAHVLVATARPLAPAPVLSPTDPVQEGFSAVLESPRPDFTYQHFLDDVAELSTRVSADSLRRHLEALESWILADDDRAASFVRVDSLLTGHVFEWRPPATGPGLAVAPATKSRFAVAPTPAAGPRAAVIFINGISNDFAEATANQSALQALASASSAALGSGRTRYLKVYSPSVLLPLIGENACERRVIENALDRPGFLWALLTLPLSALRSRVEQELGCSFTQDHLEAVLQAFDESFLRGWLQSKGAPLGASVELKRTVDVLHEEGRVVIVVAHSQGNLMTSQAMRELATLNEGPSLCTSYVGVAAPGPQNPGSAAPVSQVTVRGQRTQDFVLTLFPDNGSEKVATTLSARLDAESWDLPQWAARIQRALSIRDGLQLHNFVSSYLHPTDGTQTRAWIAARLAGSLGTLDEECKGRFRANVVDASTGKGLGGAILTVRQDAQAPVTGTSDGAGVVSSPKAALRPAVVEFTAPDYDTVWVASVEPRPQGVTQLGTVALTRRSAADGTLRVTVVDDGTGFVLSSATVVARRGEVVAGQAVTGATGVATLKLKAGFYTVEVSRPGYRPSGPVAANVPENAVRDLGVKLVNLNTADFSGVWTYSQYCNADLGHVNAEARYLQEGARVTGDIRILQTRQGGGWFKIEGAVVSRTMTGNSTEWIEQNPLWFLNRGWTQTVSVDGSRIEGASPITGCPQVGWTRVQGSRPSRTMLPQPREEREAAGSSVPQAPSGSAAGSMVGRPR